MIGMYHYRIVLSWVILISGMCLFTSCSPVISLTPQEEATEIPTEGNTIQMTPTLPTPAEPALQRLIEKAIDDLAQRLAVSTNEIILLEATSVIWPDGSLGCPEEGMVYAQVLTPGYLIRLQSEDQEFEYHASRGTEVVYCENPMPPVEGTPGDV